MLRFRETREGGRRVVGSGGGDGSGAEPLSRYLLAQARALEDASDAARHGDPEGVHDVRVAARRARSALAAHRRLLPRGRRDEARALERDLREHAAGLSARRDAEAAGELVVGWADARAWPADRTRRVLATLTERSTAAEQADGAVADPDRLLSARSAAALAGRVFAAGDAVDGCAEAGLRRGVRRSWRRVQARWDVARARLVGRPDGDDRATGDDERAVALHEVRKAAKRLRYAAEVAAEGDRGADAVAAAARGVQRLLGDRQDAVVVAGLLAAPAADETTDAAVDHARRLADAVVDHADVGVLAAVDDLRGAVRRWTPG